MGPLPLPPAAPSPPPASCALGDFSVLKAKGTGLREQFGPSRRLAALPFADSFDSPPSTWDGAAASLIAHSPGPISRTPLRDEGLNLDAPASKPRPPQPSMGRKNGIVKLRGDTQMPLTPMTVTTEVDSPDAFKDKEATSSEVGNVCQVDSPSD